MGDEIERKPGGDKVETGGPRAEKPDHLKPDRAVTGAQVKDVQATNPDKFSSMTDLKALSEPLTPAEIKAAKGFDSFGIDFGDGTVLTGKGVQQEQPGSAEATGTVIDYQPSKTDENSYALGMDYEETPPRARPGPAENFEGGAHQAITPEALTNSPEGWLAVTQKIAELPMDKQFEVIGTALMSGLDQYTEDERQRSWGRLIGTVQGTGEVLQGLAKIADFSAACILGDNETAGKMGAEFGTALGQTIIGGVRLFQAADQYLYDIGYTGDYARPFHDVVALGQKLDEEWSQKTPFEQERIKAKLITELVESGAIGAGGAGAIQKASKFTEILDTVAVETQQLHTVAKPAIQRAANAISNAVDDLVQPVGDTGMGIRMPIPKDTSRKLEDYAVKMEGHRPSGDQAYRGDHDPYSRINDLTGRAKSYINETGDLTPPDPVGLFKGKPVDIVHHLCGSFYKYHKECSPFTSFSESGESIVKYGDRFKITADLKALEKAITNGEVTGVEIIPHGKVLQMIEESPCAEYSKKKAMAYAVADKELLVRGVLPKRFFKVEDLHK